MSKEPLNVPLPEELVSLETSLTSLSPAPVGLDRDQLMYECGFSAARCGGSTAARPTACWFWPVVAASLAMICAAQGTLLVLHAGRTSHEFIVRDTRPSPQQDDAASPPHFAATSSAQNSLEPNFIWPEASSTNSEQEISFLRMQQIALAHGVNALPDPESSHRGLPVWRLKSRHELLPGELRGS